MFRRRSGPETCMQKDGVMLESCWTHDVTMMDSGVRGAGFSIISLSSFFLRLFPPLNVAQRTNPRVKNGAANQGRQKGGRGVTAPAGLREGYAAAPLGFSPTRAFNWVRRQSQSERNQSGPVYCTTSGRGSGAGLALGFSAPIFRVIASSRSKKSASVVSC